MPKFQVTSTGLARMSQTVTVEAEDAQQAEEKVRSDEFDTYHGNQVWEYLGMEENSIEVEVTPMQTTGPGV